MSVSPRGTVCGEAVAEALPDDAGLLASEACVRLAARASAPDEEVFGP